MLPSIVAGLVLTAVVFAVFRFALPHLRGTAKTSAMQYPAEDDVTLGWLVKLRVNYTEDEMRQMLEEVRSGRNKASFYARKHGSKLIFRVIRAGEKYRVVPLLRGYAARTISEAEFGENYEYLSAEN
jgi:hypothetical protein